MAFEKKPFVKRSSSDTGRRRMGRRKGCRFCADATLGIDYKDVEGLRNFLTERGKIIPRRISGNCASTSASFAKPSSGRATSPCCPLPESISAEI